MKYLENGIEVSVIDELKSGGFLVADILDLGDLCDDYIEGHPYVVSEVFDKPPTKRCNEKIKKLEEEISELRDKKKKINKELRDLQEQQEKQKEKFKQVAALKKLEDVIDGKITHYVENTSFYSLRIITAEEAANSAERNYNAEILSFVENSNGDLVWKTPECRNSVIPCTSYEEALELVHKVIEADVKKTINHPETRVYKKAQKFNYKLPEKYVKKIKDMEEIRRQEEIEKLKKELAKYETMSNNTSQ